MVERKGKARSHGRCRRERCRKQATSGNNGEKPENRTGAAQHKLPEGLKAAVITVSDKASSGVREDRGGPLLADYLKGRGIQVVYQSVVPDEVIRIKEAISTALGRGADLILTTGGTGFSERDVTPEATLEMIERHVPGIPEYIRLKSSETNKNSVLSRAVCGIISRSIVLNLPGKPEAAVECLDLVMEPLAHGIEILKGEVTEHD